MDLFISIINLGEVFYRLAKKGRRGEADAFVRALRRRVFPLAVVPATARRVWDAAAIKARHAVSYADAFAVALALEKEAAIVTGDPEILALEARQGLVVEPLHSS